MKKMILLAAAALLIVGCNSEDNNIDEPVAAQISATIGGSDLSRAKDVNWDKGDNVGISMSSRYVNIKYTTENGDGAFTGPVMYFKNKVEPVTLTAYYPFSGPEGQTPALIEASTGAERQTPEEQIKFDFLYDKKENVTGANPNVNFTFKHMMSKLTLTFKNGTGMDVRMITSCEINGLILDGAFNPVTGDCSVKSGTSASALNLTPTVENEKALPSLILFPQDAPNVTMKITDIQNQEYSCELKFNGGRLVAGNNYCYTIKVNKTGLIVEEYSIANWTEEPGKAEAKSE